METMFTGQRNATEDLVQKWQKADCGVKGAITPLLQFISTYPITALFIGVTLGLASLPLVMFVSFALTSLLFTIFGFVVVEGTLLAIAFFVFSVVFFMVVCTSVFITGILVFTWSSAAVGYGMANRIQAVILHHFPWLNETYLQQQQESKKEQ